MYHCTLSPNKDFQCAGVAASLRQHVHDAVLVGLEKAAETLHCTDSKPEIAFPAYPEA